MLRIRLFRVGKKKKPAYRLVIAEHSAPIQGKFLEIIGHYDPFSKKAVFDKNKAMDWMNKGAKPSNIVAKIFQKAGLKHKSIVIEKFPERPAKAELKKEKPADAKAQKEVKAQKETTETPKEEAVTEGPKETAEVTGEKLEKADVKPVKSESNKESEAAAKVPQKD